jgi:tRNA U34 5-methylaminomethyl-2-thiouridine-forming methyltransferase MnmC
MGRGIFIRQIFRIIAAIMPIASIVATHLASFVKYLQIAMEFAVMKGDGLYKKRKMKRIVCNDEKR